MLATSWHEMAKSQRIIVGLFVLYAAVQVATLLQITHYYPNGFKTENYFSPLGAYLAANGWAGIVSFIDGTIPDIFGYGPTFRPPLFSVTLAGIYALLGEREIYGLILNNVFLTLTLLVIHLMGRRVSPSVGLIAPFLMMLDPIFLAEANSNQSDTMFMFFVVLSAYLLVVSTAERPSFPLLALGSIALVIAIFTRHAGLYIPVFIAAGLVGVYGVRKNLGRLACVLLVLVVVVLPPIGGWMARNQAITGNPDFAGGSTATYLANFFLPKVVALRDGIPPSEAQRRIAEAIPKHDNSSSSTEEGDLERYLVDLVIAELLENPLLTTVVMIDNIPKLFLSYPFEVMAVFADEENFLAWKKFDWDQFNKTYDRSNWDFHGKLDVAKFYLEHHMIVPLIYGVISKIINGVALLLCIFGLVVLVREKEHDNRALGYILIAYIGCLTLVSVPVASARFRIPIEPLIFISAGVATEWIAGAVWRRGR